MTCCVWMATYSNKQKFTDFQTLENKPSPKKTIFSAMFFTFLIQYEFDHMLTQRCKDAGTSFYFCRIVTRFFVSSFKRCVKIIHTSSSCLHNLEGANQECRLQESKCLKKMSTYYFMLCKNMLF